MLNIDNNTAAASTESTPLSSPRRDDECTTILSSPKKSAAAGATRYTVGTSEVVYVYSNENYAHYLSENAYIKLLVLFTLIIVVFIWKNIIQRVF